MSAKTLDFRTVLDAIPAKGATLTEIAESLNTPANTAHNVLTSLLVGGLVFMRFPFQQPQEWAKTARARRMTDADNTALAAQISAQLAWATSLPGGGAR